MCAAEAAVGAASPSPRAPVRAGRVAYGSIVLIGGGCYGSYYLRQLTRARDAGALTYERLVVVDRDPRCRVALAAEHARAGDCGAPGAGTGAGESANPDATLGRGGGPPQLHDRPELDVARHHFAAVRLEIA